jgi:Holliday junction resolvase RusA-like endonuclease
MPCPSRAKKRFKKNKKSKKRSNGKMKINFFERCHLPTATAQQQRHAKAKTYDTGKIKYARAMFQAIFEMHRPAEPMDGALRMQIDLYYPHTDKSARKAASVQKTRIPKTTAPDFDNAAKIICDAMAKAGMIVNDARIADGRIRKWHADVEGIKVLIIDIEEHDRQMEMETGL